MNPRFNINWKALWILCILLFNVACQDTIPNRSTITPGSKTTDGTTDDEPTTPVRPTGAITFKDDFCACKDGKPISYGNCATFCAGRSTGGAETFYANFTVSEAISLSGLGNVANWCNQAFETDTANPKCQLEAKDSEGNVSNIEVTTPANTNSITANIQDNLAFDKTYVLTLVETISGARSNSIQLIKFSEETPISTLGPLKNAPISQYSCVIRNLSLEDVNGSQIPYFDSAYRMHFYFLPSIPPNPIPAGTANIICHDIWSLGKNDDELFPRLENIPGIFNLWDTTDPRFYDNNANTVLDINDVILQKTKNFGGSIPAGTNFFAKFSWPGSPVLSTDAGNTSTTQPIGYYMAPWIDQSTFKSYCLTSTNYNSTNPLFKAFRDVIGVDTEGLYIGEKAAETITLSDGTTTQGLKDYILIRETDLKSVWFYLKNNVPTIPTDAIVSGVAVYFYYPLNKSAPYVKTSSQRVYRVRGAAELSGQSTTAANASGANTSYPPHDRKIGCIPKF